MFTGKYRICDAFGIPIYVETSFLFLLLLFVINMGSLSFGFAAALILALSVTMHELGHALTARAFGYRTRDIVADNGTVIVKSGEAITEAVLQKAKMANKFIELSMNIH